VDISCTHRCKGQPLKLGLDETPGCQAVVVSGEHVHHLRVETHILHHAREPLAYPAAVKWEEEEEREREEI